MTEHSPNFTMQLQAQDDPAARRAYIHKWIARNQRRMAAGLGGAVLVLPMLAQAQAADMVNALDISGVRSVAVNADGSASLTLANGQVVNVGAASVQVAADGTILISSAAAELVAEVVATAGLGAGAAGANAGAIGAAVAGLGLAAAAAGGDGSSAEPAPVFLTLGAVTGSSPVAATTLFSSFPELDELEADDSVFITIGEDGVEIPVEVNAAGEIVFPDLDLSALQGEQTLRFRVERSTVVEGEDEDGNPTSETVVEDVATGSANVVIDTIPPMITITTPIAGDDVLNAAEQGMDLTISGTAEGAEDGQVVTVSFNGQDYSATVADEAWSLTIPAEDLAGLDDDASLEITADVSDAAGNPAMQATATLVTDFTAEITIDPVIIETLNTFTGVTITGDTDGVEEGRTVTLEFNGTEYTGTVDAGGNWSIDIPDVVIDALADELEITINAAVSDEAGNPASATATTTTDFSQPALVITSPETGGFINVTDAENDIVVSGSALAGQEVIVTLNGTEETITADAENSWTVTFPASALPDEDGPITINAMTTIDGTVINAPEITLTLDTTAPSLTLESETTEAVLVLSGTTDADVEEIALMIGGESFTATAAGGTWSLTIASTDLPAADAGATVSITANATDIAGNMADEATLDLTAATIRVTSPADGVVVGLDAFEGGLTISGTTTEVAEGALVTITIMDGPDDEDGFSGTAPVGADGSWSLEILAETVQTAADLTDFTVTATAPGESYPSLASDSIGISTNFPPEITANPVGVDGALIIGEVSDTLEVSGSTRGVQAGETVTIRDADDEIIGTATVGADGTWSTSVSVAPGVSGQTVSASFIITTEAGRVASTTSQAVWYEPAEYMIMGATTVAAGAAEGALEFTFFLDPRYEPAADFGIAFGETMRFDTDVVTWAPSPAPQYLAGLTPAVNTDNAATGQVVFGGVGFLNPEDPETGEAVDLFAQRLIRFRLNHVDTDEVILLDFDSQAGGNFDFALGTEAGDTITAEVVDSTIRGRGGDDQIDVSAIGVHTIIFEGGSVANGFDTITGFTLGGAFADRFAIAFDAFDQDVLRGNGTEFQLSSGGAVGADVGLLVFTTAVADFTNATIEAALAGLTGLEAEDSLYVLIGDGTDAELTAIEFDGTEATVSTGSGTSYARFEDIGDLAAFSAANILGFAPLAEV